MEIDTKRYDGKLDSFLRRNLPHSEYERVSTSESCVVIQPPEEKRAHKYAILGHRCLYLADFPPKNLRVAVLMENITGISVLNDLPDFLSGKEREEAIHILVRYRRNVSQDKGALLEALAKRSPAVLRKLGRKRGVDLSQRAHSPLVKSRQLPPSNSPSSPPSPPQYNNPHSSSSTVTGTSTTHLSFLHHSNNMQHVGFVLSHSSHTLSTGSPNDNSDDITKTPPTPSPLPPPPPPLPPSPAPPPGPKVEVRILPHLPNDKQSSTAEKVATSPHNIGRAAATARGRGSPCFSRAGGSFKAKSNTTTAVDFASTTAATCNASVGGRSISKVSKSSSSSSLELVSSWPSFESVRQPNSTRDRNREDDLDSQMYSTSSFHSSSSTSSLVGATGETESIHQPSSSSSFSALGRNCVPSADYRGYPHQMSSSSSSGNGNSGGGGGGAEGSTRTEAATLDIYVLKQTSDFYHQLSAVWEDWKILSTLQSDESGTTQSPSSNDRIFHQYCSLKQDLFSSRSLSARARYLQELCTACQRYFSLKKMFWEDSELVEFCVEQLKRYLSSQSGASCAVGYHRADQIEYSILVLDLLHQMLRETHTCRKKLVLFLRNGGHFLQSLAVSLTDLLPSREELHQLELIDLDKELTESSSGVLYEALRVAQQAKWPQAKHSVVSTGWLVGKMAASSRILHLCERAVTYMVDLFSGSLNSYSSGIGTAHTTTGTTAASPPEKPRTASVEGRGRGLVSLHHLAYLLNALVQHSPRLSARLHSRFAEEFKYYISVTGAKQKLPGGYALRNDTLDLMHSVKTKILQS